MTNPSVGAEDRQHYSEEAKARRYGFAFLSLLCLGASVFLLYSITLLHFAAGSWAFLRIPDFDPRPMALFEDIAIICCQLMGGVALAVSWMPNGTPRRWMKWSPLFVAIFALLTWLVALAVAPFHMTR